jgi:hypothetical protein
MIKKENKYHKPLKKENMKNERQNERMAQSQTHQGIQDEPCNQHQTENGISYKNAIPQSPLLLKGQGRGLNTLQSHITGKAPPGCT